MGPAAIDGPVRPRCGFEFSWRDIFNPQYATPNWSVEHEPAGRNPVRRTPTAFCGLAWYLF